MFFPHLPIFIIEEIASRRPLHKEGNRLSIEEVKDKIEILRKELVELALQYGARSIAVLQKSQELDEMLNTYAQLSKR